MVEETKLIVHPIGKVELQPVKCDIFIRLVNDWQLRRRPSLRNAPQSRQCKYDAKYSIDGKRLCKLHAGVHLIDNYERIGGE